MSRKISIEAILKYAIDKWASDVHLSTGKYVTYRIQGKLHRMTEAELLSKEDIASIQSEMLEQYPKQLKLFKDTGDLDFAYMSDDDTSFRVNAFRRLQKTSFVFRRIEKEPVPMSELKLPVGVQKFLTAKQGLVLVTGPTGAGKSTTLVAMLEEINKTRSEHIITIEDPIEFVFTDKKSIFSQREVWRDTQSFVKAIRAAMREDPDIVMIGEMRDVETVEAALSLAETGHLVFSTLHTSGSVATISRIIQFFKSNIQHQIQARLWDALLWVLSQRLLPRRDTEGRVAMHEMMYLTPGIKNIIRTWDIGQLNNAIELGRSEGMLPMKISAKMLEKSGKIYREDWIHFFKNKDEIL